MHHVYGRGNRKELIFRDDLDRRHFLNRLSLLKAENRFSLFAYCLMPNHYHLALRTGSIPLSRFMMRLLTYYARAFNDRWNLVGHPFQGRYNARPCFGDNDLRGIIRYIHLNPSEAGLVSEPSDWPWSSHRAFIGNDDSLIDKQAALSLFGGDVQQYREFMAETLTRHEREPLLELADRVIGLQALEAIRTSRCDSRTNELRRQFVGSAALAGYRCGEIAKFLGKVPSSISRLTARQS